MNYLCPLCHKLQARRSSTYPSLVVCDCTGKLLEVGIFDHQGYHPGIPQSLPKLYVLPLKEHYEVDNLIQDRNRRYNIYNALNDHKNKVVSISTKPEHFLGYQKAKEQIIVAVTFEREIKLWFNDEEMLIDKTMFPSTAMLKKFLQNQGLLQND